MEDIIDIWLGTTEILRKRLNADTYDRWISGIVPLRLEGGVAYLGVSSELFSEWLTNHYSDLIRESIETSCGLRLKVVFESGHELPEQRIEVAEVAKPSSKSKVASTGVDSGSNHRVHDGDVLSPSLNKRYTFDQFVVGDGSRFAYSACLAVAKSPGTAYNPLLVHSTIGLGKTHLLQSIAHETLRKNPRAKVEYLTSEAFCNQYTLAIQHNALPAFRQRFRDVDVLLVDDVQFFGTKTGFQEEFFHTFNAMHSNHRQIVLASDRPPQEINGLEKRLVSRFEWGLTTEIQAPDLETRIAIIRKKQEEQTVKLNDDVINYLAARLKSSVRRLEGAVFSLVSNSCLTGQSVTLDMVEQTLKNIFLEEADTQVTVDHIQRLVAEHYDIRLADMTSAKRPASIAWPRQIAMYFSRKLTDLSYPAIAEQFRRSHATVLHAFSTVEQKIYSNQDFKREIEVLERKLKS